MKTFRLIMAIAFMCAASVANADIAVNNRSVRENGTVAATTNNDEPKIQISNDKFISLDRPSQVVIYNSRGYVVYYNEQMDRLDCSNWQKGRYIAVVGGKEVFKFTI